MAWRPFDARTLTLARANTVYKNIDRLIGDLEHDAAEVEDEFSDMFLEFAEDMRECRERLNCLIEYTKDENCALSDLPTAKQKARKSGL